MNDIKDNIFDWEQEADMAVTICDKEGTIVFMNEKSKIQHIHNGSKWNKKTNSPTTMAKEWQMRRYD